MKTQHAVYVGGEWERNCHTREALATFRRWADREPTRAEEKKLKDGLGLRVDALIFMK